MVSTNNKRAFQPDTKASAEHPQVSDTANIANSRYPTKSKVGPIPAHYNLILKSQFATSSL